MYPTLVQRRMHMSLTSLRSALVLLDLSYAQYRAQGTHQLVALSYIKVSS